MHLFDSNSVSWFEFHFFGMADLAHLVALRQGGRTAATRISERLDEIVGMAEMLPEQNVYELEKKFSELNSRLLALEDLDERIQELTEEDDLRRELENTDLAANIPFRNAIDLHRFQLNVLRCRHDINTGQNQIDHVPR